MAKKSLKFLLLAFPLMLTSCGDSGFIYQFKEGVSNKNGSMSYEIFVREFYDANGDGIGDLLGVKEKLSYLADLGIKTVWLMPIHESNSYHGYDVINYCSVEKDYGTLADFDALVAEAATYNIDIMLDMVFNHTSSSHPWFHESYINYNSTFGGDYEDYYVWSETGGNHYYKYRNLYYESSFDSSMPDLNLDSESVRDEIDNICKFWIQDHGVKGFRLDAVLHYYGGTSKNVEFLTWLKETCLKYDPNFYMVGECYSGEETVLAYANSKCDSFFNFNAALTGSNVSGSSILSLSKGMGRGADAFGDNIQWYEETLKENNPKGYSSYFLTNHDLDRASKYYYDDFVINNKAAASLYCLLPGTPFMYYGEEISLMGIRGSENSDRLRRLPMIWSKKNKTGECIAPEYASGYEQVKIGVNDALKDGDSLLNHYKKVINIRNQLPFMKNGIFTNMTEQLECRDPFVLGYKITLEDEGAIFIHNFEKYAVTVNNIGSTLIDEIPTTGKNAEFNGNKIIIQPHSSVILSL